MSIKKIWGPFLGTLLLVFGLAARPARAMPIGTLLYRTSDNGNLYGYNQKDLIVVENGQIKHLYTGHVAIYVGKENGVDYIVEAQPGGLIKVPAQYFIDTREGEKLIGAKIPKNLTPAEQEKVATLAETLAASNYKYDFDFQNQKGPGSGEFTCVGLTEKIYESANIKNPKSLQDLVYNPDEYAVNITPDGFDNKSVYKASTQDCFSKNLEFSKISRLTNLLAPAPELIGYDAGRIYQNERYFFLPYTQFLQPTLKDVAVDIPLSSDFNDSDIRGSVPQLALLFRWSLINNPVSSVKIVAAKVSNWIETAVSKVFGDKDILVTDEAWAGAANSSTAKVATIKKTTAKKTTTKKTSVKKSASKKTTAKKTTAKKTATKTAVVKTNASSLTPAATTKMTAKKTVVATPKETVVKKTTAKKTVTKKASSATTPTYNIINTAPVRQQILISKIYTTGLNDFIELYNPNNEAIDLAQENFRLEKAKTAADPVIIMRIGNPADGTYPGGTEIAAQGTYLIVRQAATSSSLKAAADAIAASSNFSLDGSGYTIYLGDNAISSPTDADIIDEVGFGADATYYKGGGSAPEILDHYVLMRKADSASTPASMSAAGVDDNLGFGYDSGSNKDDFVLVLRDKIVDTDVAANTDSTDNNDSSDISDNTNNADDTGVATSTDISDNTSDTSAATSTDIGVATSTDIGAATSTDIGAATSTDATTDNSAANNSDNTDIPGQTIPPIVISKIYTTAKNDYIELYNTGDSDFDLAANNYRLEKTKTAVDPVILMRFGNDNDGTYPGGTIIKAHGSYLIVRDEATSTDLKAAADAIATGTNFTFESSGYTIYLGDDAISSPTDADIIDTVGFGADATYYEGSGPAPEILDNEILTRKATAISTVVSMSPNGADASAGYGYDSDNNAQDFVLIPEKGAANNSGTGGDNDSSSTGFTSSGLIHLWHLDDCRGATLVDSVGQQDFSAAYHAVNHWEVGKFGCALEQYYGYAPLQTTFSPKINTTNFSLSFYYESTSDYSRPAFKFSNSADPNDVLQMLFDPAYTEFWGLPDHRRFDGLGWPADGKWHQVVLTINGAQDYFEIYRDGQKIYHQDFQAIYSAAYDTFQIYGDNGYDYIDELALWNRSLSATEIAAMYNSNLELKPATIRAVQKTPQLIHHWSFDERTGTVAHDDIAGDNINLSSSLWIKDGAKNGAIYQDYQHNLEADFKTPFTSDDLSLEFWWRNRSFPDEGRGQFTLRNGGDDMFSLVASPWTMSYYFDGRYDIISTGFNQTIPYDSNWHHLALVYNSYDYVLNFYVDGVLKWSRPWTWMSTNLIDRLQLIGQNYPYEIDEIGVWDGALSAAQVAQLAQRN